MNIEKPNYTWHCSIPFSRAKRDYVKDREHYEEQFLTRIELIRKKQGKTINSVSALFILLITTLWTFLPPLVDLPQWLVWANMGMEGFGANNWGNQLMLTIIPGTAGTVLYNAPKLLPGKKAKLTAHAIIKIIPILMLILCWYLIKTEMLIKQIKRIEKDEARAKITDPIQN